MSRVTISRLRSEHPDWTWAAERAGMGWRYVGTRDAERVVLTEYAILGSFEDCSGTAWYVDDGMTSVDFATWAMSRVLCVEWKRRDDRGVLVHGGWCAVTDRDERAVSTKTACDHVVTFPGRYETRTPTCGECIAALRPPPRR